MSIFHRKQEPNVDGPSGAQPGGSPRDLPEELLWLADAPLFIDEQRVEAFYDAVFRPDYDETTRTLGATLERNTKVGGRVNLGTLIPGLFARAGVEMTGEHARSKTRSDDVALRPVTNAYRHLLALALHYATANPRRLALARTPGHATDGAGDPLPTDWLHDSDEFVSRSPRALIMLELTPAEGCELIPAALETDDGTVHPVFETLLRSLTRPGEPAGLDYPGSRSPVAERNRYWQWFADNFNDRAALKVVEDAAAGRSVQWIAFRVPFGDPSGSFFHLGLATRGRYDTGVFGYNLINRGAKHGLRIVGTLKSEPDIDVLAVFER